MKNYKFMIEEKRYILPINIEEAIDFAATHKGDFKYLARTNEYFLHRSAGNFRQKFDIIRIIRTG